MKQRAQAWRDEAIKEIVDKLTDLGQRACRHAIIHRGYDNRKFNLVDSIGSAVYIDGVLEPSTKRYAYSTEFSTEPYEDKGYPIHDTSDRNGYNDRPLLRWDHSESYRTMGASEAPYRYNHNDSHNRYGGMGYKSRSPN